MTRRARCTDACSTDCRDSGSWPAESAISLAINRVAGVTPALGARFALGPSLVLRAHGGIGLSDHRVVGSVGVEGVAGPAHWSIAGERLLRDVSDVPVISGLANSLSTAISGDDYGDYTLVHAEFAPSFMPRSDGARAGFELGEEWSRSVATSFTPLTGSARLPTRRSASGRRRWLGAHLARRRPARPGLDSRRRGRRRHDQLVEGAFARTGTDRAEVRRTAVRRRGRHRVGPPAGLSRLRAGRSGHLARLAVPLHRRPASAARRGGVGPPAGGADPARSLCPVRPPPQHAGSVSGRGNRGRRAARPPVDARPTGSSRSPGCDWIYGARSCESRQEWRCGPAGCPSRSMCIPTGGD